jgi:hypothetical protein
MMLQRAATDRSLDTYINARVSTHLGEQVDVERQVTGPQLSICDYSGRKSSVH